jgi:hypothetical protein
MRIELEKLLAKQQFVTTIAPCVAKWTYAGKERQKQIPKAHPVALIAFVDRPAYGSDGGFIGIDRLALISCNLTEDVPAFIPRECITVD